MRFFTLALLLIGLLFGPAAEAATGRVIKVLPHFTDKAGRTSLSPSLFERDAYQARLRNNPELRAGLRFAVQWKARGSAFEPLKLRVELRGTAEANLPKTESMEMNVERRSRFSQWTYLNLDGYRYKQFGEVTAWRVTLWEGDQLLAEQTSFLW